MRHVPSTLLGEWSPLRDILAGSEKFGDPNDNTKSWAIYFKDMQFTHFIVESADKTFSERYHKAVLSGAEKMGQNEFLGNDQKIKNSGGVNIYINLENGDIEMAARWVFYQVAEGMRHLHDDHRIAHRDLKHENILMGIQSAEPENAEEA